MPLDQDRIKKKDAVRLVRRRLKDLLKPLGFQEHPHFKGRLMRIRGELIDEISLRTDGSHLEPLFFVYYRPAPFAGLHADSGRLWRIMQEHITTSLEWKCIIPDKPPYHYYYESNHFETVWEEVVLALEHWILPYLDKLTVKDCLSFFIKAGETDEDFFCAYKVVFMNDLYFTCMSEAAVYGIGMWKLGKYEEGLPYIIFAQKKYRQWIAAQEQTADHFYRSKWLTLGVLNHLIAAWSTNSDNWMAVAQEQIERISENWVDFLP